MTHPDALPVAEFEVVRAAARAALVPDDRASLVRALGAEVDWDVAMELAAEHGMRGLVFHETAAHAELQPEAIRAAGRRERMMTLAWSVLASHALPDALTALRTRGIDAMPFKGLVISLAAYGRLDARQFSDLDMLVDRSEVEAAAQALGAIGYRRLDSGRDPRLIDLHGQVSLGSGLHTIAIDLHWRISPAYFPVRLPVSALRRDAQELRLDEVSFRAPSNEHLLITTAMHAARSGWSRLEWALSIAMFGGRAERGEIALDFDRAVAEARRVGCLRMLAVGFAVARELFGVTPPAEVAKAIDGRAESLARVAIEQLRSRHPFAIGFDTAVFRARIRDRAFDAVRGLMAPTEQDLLSERSSMLAAMIRRPWRLARRYGRRLWK
jgi:hypothetical protein